VISPAGRFLEDLRRMASKLLPLSAKKVLMRRVVKVEDLTATILTTVLATRHLTVYQLFESEGLAGKTSRSNPWCCTRGPASGL
jgi:hypothetical protein